MNADEYIVLLDESHNPIGSAPKLASHHANTPLHLAFSCYVFNQEGKFLVTKRAHTKKVWPDVWTNSFCGHPAPGESMEDAILRRAKYELGISELNDLRCVIPDYRYTTEPYNGIIENEFCPVYVTRISKAIMPNADEVGDFEYIDWDDFRTSMAEHPKRYSHWAKEQVVLLDKYVREHVLQVIS
jgi:isopentenyl-diphosphate delta-isomerase